MTVSGRITFEGSSLTPPTDLTRVRVSLQARGQQAGMEMGPVPPAEVDAADASRSWASLRQVRDQRRRAGRWQRTGRGNHGRPGPPARAARHDDSRRRASAAVGTEISRLRRPRRARLPAGHRAKPGRVRHGLDVHRSNTGSVGHDSGYARQADGRLHDHRVPDRQSILAAAIAPHHVVTPGTDGKFTFRNLPPGDYRITAVTDVEPGEWYNPDFLSQLVNASIQVQLGEGERKVQDIRVK
jgi:hypothetical protein